MTGRDTTGVNVVRRSRQRLNNLLNAQQQPQAPAWYRIVRNAAEGAPTRVDIYEEIGGNWLFGGLTAVDFVAELATINGDLEVHINSPGGDVFDGLAIYNALAQRPGNVTTIVDGLAASAASFIAMAGKARLMCPGAMMMIHDAAGMCMGNASDMRELADLLDKVSDNIAAIYAAHATQPTDWRAAMKAETWYTADEAVAAGLAHKLAPRPAEDALAAVARFDLSAYLRVPDRLRNAAAPAGTTHGPFDGTHTHAHAAFGSQGDDASHEHEHSHSNDADHHHGHGDGAASDAAHRHVRAADDVSEAEAAARQLVAAGYTPQQIAKWLANGPLPVHHTATEDSAWDGPAAVKAMPNDDAVLRYCHAWQTDEAENTPHKSGDDDADDKKSAYKFPHHRTKGGPANVAACRNGLARLENSSIPEADKAGVRAHLQAHLDDAHKGDDDGASDHAELPAWIHDHARPLPPAWFTPPAEEAK
jgi:ATP-dependent Clp endopeptidase proteolytic subunit ClpP